MRLLIFCLILIKAQYLFAACDKTISVGADLAVVAANAVNGSTICLDAGNYGTVSFDNIQRTGFVTLRSTSGQTATLSVQTGASSYLRFQSLTLSGAYVHGCAHHIEVIGNRFTQGMLINNRDGVCPGNLNLIVDGNDFGDMGGALWEGRLSIGDRDSDTNPMGLIVRNNHFHDGCQSDGVQVVGGAGGITIGPGNIFENIIQIDTPVHCDSIQFYSGGPPSTVIGNWFKNSSVAIQHHPSPNNTVFRDNLLTNVAQIQIGQSPGFIFEHNTIFSNLGYWYWGMNQSSGISIKNNILVGDSFGPNLDQSTGIYSHQLCEKADQCFGSNTKIGAPKFVGGANPTSWAGFKLASDSFGVGAGSDGKDIGINFYGDNNPISFIALVAPKNLRIVSSGI